ncbi:hypothetical protein V1264_002174 [Littorina saxatilis]|uniref:Integrase catalytic domain-containing protein n=2 Tax=Littorina saxatilis TaxID=31220 RepID=A0AAN9GPQ3_9CAEN
MLQDVKTAAVSKESKNQHDYHILRKYEVLQCGPVEKLIKKREHSEETPMYFVTIEETFDVLRASHIATGHGGRDRMMKEIKKKYANISVQAIELFKSLCLECQKKRTRPKTTGVVVRPILTKDFSCRGQVDLVDMQSMSCNGYKWIMVYQDHLTKFCVLRAIRSKRPTEVASQLLDIFLLLGAPVILQSDNGTEFTANVISELTEFWPSLKMVHGKPRYPQSQGSVERANCDIKDMLVAWLADNKSQDWVAGIKFVQFHKNSAYHSGIKRSPYSALFGNEARVGLTSSTLPREILDNLESEDDLARLDLPQPASRAASSVVADNSTADANLTSAEPSASPDATLTSAEPSALSTDTTLTSAEPSASADATLTSAEPSALSTDTTLTSAEPSASADATLTSAEPSASADATLISADPTTTTADPLQTSDASMLTAHVERVTRARKEAFSGQLSQAERMVKRSRVDFKCGEVGDNVAVPVPMVDRGRGDARNILGVILNRDISTDIYTVAVKAGVLKVRYSRNQFDLCPQRLLSMRDVNLDKHVSLRSAIIAESASGGQGFTKCNCAGGPRKCQTNKCSCYKAKLKCNSKCHGSLTCRNK